MPTLAIDPHKLEELLNYWIGFAKQMVESHGAFHPFGAVIVSAGTLNAVGADNRSSSQSLINDGWQL